MSSEETTINTKLINDLLQKSNDLKDKTEKLNECFEYVEKCLNDMNLGITEWTDGYVGVDYKHNFGYKFGFCKVNNRWKLVCRKVELGENFPNDKDKKYGLLEYVTGMPRSIRIEASEKIENLLKKIIKRADRYAKDIDYAVHNFDNTEKILGSY